MACSAEPRNRDAESVAPTTPYAELHCLSNYSFLRGASHPEELVERACLLGYAALAVTDECSVGGLVRAHVAAKTVGLKLICGSEFTLACGTRIVALVPDRAGWAELCTLITRGRRAAEKGRYHLTREDVAEVLKTCLVLVASEGVEWAVEQFPGRAWLLAELHAGADDVAHVAALRALAARHGLPVAAAGDVHMHARSRRAVQDLVTAIRHRCTVADAGARLFPNGERHLRSGDVLARAYPPEWLAETVAVAARCDFVLDELRYEYPEEIAPRGETTASWLRKLTEDGIRWRWPDGVSAAVRAQVEAELALITELGYEPYFLTVYDVVRFARERGILCQGRGSAANSAVCYCLGITEVDPARTSMLFGRFISRERDEPPDIDVDFEHERREEVIQYIYNRYGRDRAAIAATVICYRPRSAVRDVAKALGFDAAEVERIAGSVSGWDDQDQVRGRLAEAGLDVASPRVVRLLALTAAINSFPRPLSQHVGGFVIARGKLHELVPIENAAMAERTVIQWDKDDIDALGLLKVDVLALGMLSAIRKALAMLGLTMQDVPADDPEVWRMVQRADTVGVFQIESRAQMAMLPKLKPACFYDLVIEVAIVRPGPIQGDMVHPYLARRAQPALVDYPSAELKRVLERTLGVPIFQEQVMEIAMVAAGFSAGEADQLRRAMAAWKRSGGLEPFEARLKAGMLARGYDEAFADTVFQQIRGFGEYGFPESHSASFALLVWVSAWLKCRHPAEFTAALLNSQPMGFYAPAQLVQDARRHGVEVRPPCVQASAWDCTIEDGALRLGLRLVRGLREAAADALVAARPAGGFRSADELVQRAGVRRDQVELLARAGALAAVAGHRHRAAWAVAGAEAGAPLAPPVDDGPALPLLPAPAEGEDILADYAQTGLTLRRHPLALLRARLDALRVASAERINGLPNGTPVTAAGLVINRQRPGSANGVTFMTLEDDTGHVNVIVWPQVAERQQRVLTGARLMAVRGVLQRDGDVLHVVARRLEDHSALIGDLAVRSRDFH